MARAVWNGAVLAESNDIRIVEGNAYFPPESVNHEYFRRSESRTRCPWKGVAGYWDVVVGDAVNRDAAWHYPEVRDAAKPFENYVAFWRGVKIEGLGGP